MDGPVGKLEAIVDTPRDTELRGRAVVCHPHPQHGGTMHNKVAHTLARAFVRSGFTTLRFNFRGTEDSEGHYDEGVGELDDALAALDWIRKRETGGALWLGGFSFGAAIAIRAAVATPLDGLVSIAPAVYRFAKRARLATRLPVADRSGRRRRTGRRRRNDRLGQWTRTRPRTDRHAGSRALFSRQVG